MPKKKIKAVKKVWFAQELWDVKEILKPTKFDTYLLLSKKDEEHCNEDGSSPVLMSLVDTGNDEFYPNTPEVKRYMKSIRQSERNIEQRSHVLSRIWLDFL